MTSRTALLRPLTALALAFAGALTVPAASSVAAPDAYAATSPLTVTTPSSLFVTTPGSWITVKVKVKNPTDKAAKKVSLLASATKGATVKPTTINLGKVPGGGFMGAVMQIRLTGGRPATVTFTAKSPLGKSAPVKVSLIPAPF